MTVGSTNYEYRCTVLRIVDGDTLDLDVDLGFQLRLRMRCRLYGLNCPEVHSSLEHERKLGQAAKAFTERHCLPGMIVTVRSHTDGKEKFGRWLAEVNLPSGVSLNKSLIIAGHAKAWDGTGPRPL